LLGVSDAKLGVDIISSDPPGDELVLNYRFFISLASKQSTELLRGEFTTN